AGAVGGCARREPRRRRSPCRAWTGLIDSQPPSCKFFRVEARRGKSWVNITGPTRSRGSIPRSLLGRLPPGASVFPRVLLNETGPSPRVLDSPAFARGRGITIATFADVTGPLDERTGTDACW